jgi:lipopolysaccharide/colanic/teichoic acid biosynthesis glycosyltransferase
VILQTNRLPESANVEHNNTQNKSVRATRYNHVAKLVLDYAIALPSLLLLAPLFILLTILVKLDSPGPVLYRRRVLGQDGRVFDAFKFRTMHVNGDEIWPATRSCARN